MMSFARLTAVADYLKLLLNTSVEQARCLLSTATVKQVDALCEISYNLLNCIKKLPSKIRRATTKNKKLLQKLSKKKLAFNSKLKLIKKHYQEMIHVLKAAKESLLKLL